MLHITTWMWGDKYRGGYSTRLHRGLATWMKSTTYQFRIIGPMPSDQDLLKGCLCRLRMFDPKWQAAHGVQRGDRLVCLDLDLIVTGVVDHIFDRPEDFVILGGANAANPCPYNG